MKLIEASIRYPVSTTVGVILLVLFGGIALFRIPIQLTPNVEDPIVTVTTNWPGASPVEVEREIVQVQEDQLKSVEGLLEMKSSCNDSQGQITMEFAVGTDLDAALLRVSNRLEQVTEYPQDADKPILTTVDPNANALAWFILLPTDEAGFEGEIETLYDFMDDFIRPEFERVEGVAASGIFGGRQREMHVTVDPAELAARRITMNEVAEAIDSENRNFSGGDFNEGKRRYIVRTVGEYAAAEDIDDIVVAVRNGVPVYLKDIGSAELGYRKSSARVFNKGRPIMAINASKEPDSNILEVMAGLTEAVDRVNEERLEPRGLVLRQVYDQTEYIKSAIDLVQQSLIVGGILAIVALLLYLRSGASTLIVAVAIPISIVGAFLAMYLFGRTLNVISLAGMAFAVGMVVDNSIVVLENIFRHRQMGKSRFAAAHDGAREVWGAVLASTLTTVAVFIPVAFMKEEVGQLFGDIALAISFAVALSLVISITVIPSMAAKILRPSRSDPAGGGAARRIVEGVAATVYRMTGSTFLRVFVVAFFVVASIGLSVLLMPDREYLPLGNQNFVFGLMLPPPGYNLDEIVAIQEVITERSSHLWESEAGSSEAAALPGGGVENYFFVALNNFAFMGGKSNDPLRAGELIPEFQQAASEIPGTIFFMQQRSLFERGRGAGRNIDVEITGPELETLISLGIEVFGSTFQVLPGAQAFPQPSLDLGNPEVRVLTHRQRAAELGLTNRELGFLVSALVDGAKASEFQYQGKEIDLRLRAEKGFAHRTHLLEQMPLAAPDGSMTTLGSVAEVSVVAGPVSISRIERQRAITISVTPDKKMPLEAAMNRIETEILGPMRESAKLDEPYEATLSGTADKLAQTVRSIRWNLLLALVITFLLLAALFENFLYPVVIMLSVPLAAMGGFLGLTVLNLVTGGSQPLDVLTMLGFIILIGTVVNNAILIVHQALNHIRREAMPHREAIRESVRTRMRPIFMSVTTSVMGMLPLVLFPGAGSELYRGLGSVVVGGLLVSTVFTLFLVPALFSLALDLREALAGLAQRIFGSDEKALNSK